MAGIALAGVGVAVAVVSSVLLDVEALTESLSGVVLKTVAAASLWVWLRDAGGAR